MTSIAPHPCPICDAPPYRREHLRDGFELCTRCGFAIRLNDAGALVGFATTNQSHPRGIWAASVLLVAILVGSLGCAAAHSGSRQGRPRGVLFDESYAADLQLCVPRSPFVASKYPIVCLSLGDLRAQLRARQSVSTTSPWSVR